jgi:ribonucleoside-diphosphate reductase beta chain
MGPIEGLTADQVKQYIRWIGNRRLSQLGLEPIYQVEKNPFTWLDTMLNAVEHMNFFEGRATEYSKASTKGTWAEAFS